MFKKGRRTVVAPPRKEARRKIVFDETFLNLITCYLCKGYLIHCTVIVKCHHSFCRSCIVHHLRYTRRCPLRVCAETLDIQPLKDLRADPHKDAIIMGCLPWLPRREQRRRRKFWMGYRNNNNAEHRNIDISPELIMKDMNFASESMKIFQKFNVEICLEYLKTSESKLEPGSKWKEIGRKNEIYYIRLRNEAPLSALQKLVSLKYKEYDPDDVQVIFVLAENNRALHHDLHIYQIPSLLFGQARIVAPKLKFAVFVPLDVYDSIQTKRGFSKKAELAAAESKKPCEVIVISSDESASISEDETTETDEEHGKDDYLEQSRLIEETTEMPPSPPTTSENAVSTDSEQRKKKTTPFEKLKQAFGDPGTTSHSKATKEKNNDKPKSDDDNDNGEANKKANWNVDAYLAKQKRAVQQSPVVSGNNSSRKDSASPSHVEKGENTTNKKLESNGSTSSPTPNGGSDIEVVDLSDVAPVPSTSRESTNKQQEAAVTSAPNDIIRNQQENEPKDPRPPGVDTVNTAQDVTENDPMKSSVTTVKMTDKQAASCSQVANTDSVTQEKDRVGQDLQTPRPTSMPNGGANNTASRELPTPITPVATTSSRPQHRQGQAPAVAATNARNHNGAGCSSTAGPRPDIGTFGHYKLNKQRFTIVVSTDDLQPPASSASGSNSISSSSSSGKSDKTRKRKYNRLPPAPNAKPRVVKTSGTMFPEVVDTIPVPEGPFSKLTKRKRSGNRPKRQLTTASPDIILSQEATPGPRETPTTSAGTSNNSAGTSNNSSGTSNNSSGTSNNSSGTSNNSSGTLNNSSGTLNNSSGTSNNSSSPANTISDQSSNGNNSAMTSSHRSTPPTTVISYHATTNTNTVTAANRVSTTPSTVRSNQASTSAPSTSAPPVPRHFVIVDPAKLVVRNTQSPATVARGRGSAPRFQAQYRNVAHSSRQGSSSNLNLNLASHPGTSGSSTASARLNLASNRGQCAPFTANAPVNLNNHRGRTTRPSTANTSVVNSSRATYRPARGGCVTRPMNATTASRQQHQQQRLQLQQQQQKQQQQQQQRRKQQQQQQQLQQQRLEKQRLEQQQQKQQQQRRQQQQQQQKQQQQQQRQANQNGERSRNANIEFLMLQINDSAVLTNPQHRNVLRSTEQLGLFIERERRIHRQHTIDMMNEVKNLRQEYEDLQRTGCASPTSNVARSGSAPATDAGPSKRTENRSPPNEQNNDPGAGSSNGPAPKRRKEFLPPRSNAERNAESYWIPPQDDNDSSMSDDSDEDDAYDLRQQEAKKLIDAEIQITSVCSKRTLETQDSTADSVPVPQDHLATPFVDASQYPAGEVLDLNEASRYYLGRRASLYTR